MGGSAVTRGRPTRPRLGQHFLVERRAVRRIVEALSPTSGEGVLEIGPGRGVLTAELIARCGRIAAIELDARLCAELRRRFAEEALTLLERDVLEVTLAAVGEALDRPRLVVVGNLPYAISKPIAMKLVRERRSIDRAVLMFQKEVATRLTAIPGTRAYGPLTVLCGEAFHIERLFDLPARAFRPAPRVASSVTRWRRREPCALDAPGRELALRACLAASFARRRQTLRNNLRAALGSNAAAEALLERCRLDGAARAETLPPEAFWRLAALWDERS